MKIGANLENYALIFPALLIFSVFYLIPFIWIFQLSFFDWDGILPYKSFAPWLTSRRFF